MLEIFLRQFLKAFFAAFQLVGIQFQLTAVFGVETVNKPPFVASVEVIDIFFDFELEKCLRYCLKLKIKNVDILAQDF